MRISSLLLTGLAIGGVCLWNNEARCDDAAVPFVRVSPRDPHYFETDDGRPYVPNGLNVISPPWLRSRSRTTGWPPRSVAGEAGRQRREPHSRLAQ